MGWGGRLLTFFFANADEAASIQYFFPQFVKITFYPQCA
jgi:hypothetical protein